MNGLTNGLIRSHSLCPLPVLFVEERPQLVPQFRTILGGVSEEERVEVACEERRVRVREVCLRLLELV